jgi:hypothetical protein
MFGSTALSARNQAQRLDIFRIVVKSKRIPRPAKAGQFEL